MDYLILILGLAVLILGGEFLVRGAVGFSKKMKISSLVIGMTVVAFGTSAPELLVSLKSALNGNPGIAVGNVIGSNIANIALVLGVTVMIFPIVVDRNTKRIDYPMMLFATLLLSVFALDGWFSLVEGMFMFAVLIFFLTWVIRKSRKETKSKEKENNKTNEEVEEYKEEAFWKSGLFLALGFVGLYFGADWFVKGAVSIANELLATNPNKDVIIGVTVVAFGTSAPELVASCVAAFKKETDISIGNLIGSNIFNIFAVIGLTSMVKPIEVSQSVIEFDMLWMIGITLLLLLVLYTGKKIGRLKGVILFSSYVAYITIIVLKVQGVF
ncbi:MAG: calcium/sodium antiporter [Fluviicola sp.]|nr:calcium/sodium antiporter [Fluviicola sp.]